MKKYIIYSKKRKYYILDEKILLDIAIKIFNKSLYRNIDNLIDEVVNDRIVYYKDYFIKELKKRGIKECSM